MALELLPREKLIAWLKESVADGEWLVKHLEKTQGRLAFPKILVDVIQNLNIKNYPELYEDEKLLALVGMRAWLTQEQMKEWADSLDKMSLEERGIELDAVVEMVDAGIESIPRTLEEAEQARAFFEQMSEEEKRETILRGKMFYSFFFASFGQTLAMMVHGEKMTQLVAKAKLGDDAAFFKAVQVDKSILTVIPYFRDRYARAQKVDESDFLDKLAYRIKAPPYKGKIRHKTLWVLFSILDQAGILPNMRDVELLDLCAEIGIGGANNRIEDVGYLSKRRREYKRLQMTGIASTP